MSDRNMREEVYKAIKTPRITINYEGQRSEHFGVIKNQLVCKMALQNPNAEHEILISLSRDNVCEEVQEIFAYLEDLEMSVFDDSGIFALQIAPSIISFGYDKGWKKSLEIKYKWEVR